MARSLEPTYEGLKRQGLRHNDRPYPRLEPTYEGLKRFRTHIARARRPVWSLPMRD